MKHSLTRRLVSRAATVGTAVALLVGMHGVAVAGASTLAGTATIADPTSTPLASGGSAQKFTVNLPAQASCTGDSATGGYHVYSFLVPQGTNPASLTFNPNPSVGYGLLDAAGYYGSAQTALTTGQIIAVPNDFQWSLVTSPDGFDVPLTGAGGLLYSGTSGVWETGLACANSSGSVSDYWTTEVTFTSSGTDANGFTWAAVPGVPSGAPEVPLPILLPILGLAVIGGAIGINRRRRGRLTTASVSANS